MATGETARPGRLVDYPRGRVFAVIDDASEAPDAVAALRAAGLSGGAVLTGQQAADALDGTGGRHGLPGRLIRAVQFLFMDQMPDFAWYEAALREGRAVVTVPAGDRAAGERAAAVLRSHQAHFINRFGRFETEELVRWRGPEPKIGDVLHR